MPDANMASTVHANLDEFFDFERLEYDNGLKARNQQDVSPCEPFPVQDVEAMDWQQSVNAGHDTLVALPVDAFYNGTGLDEALISPMQNSGPFEAMQYQSSLPTLGAGIDPSFSAWNMCPERRPLTPDQTLTFEPRSLSQSYQDTNVSAEYNDVQIPSTTFKPQLATLSQSERSPSISNTPYESSERGVFKASAHTALPASLRQASNATRKPASAKRKGPQSRIPLEARQMLEEEFAANPYPCSWEIDVIAHQANLDVKRVRNWYNNTRARRKCSDAAPKITELPNDSHHSLASRLSRESLDALDKNADEATEPPQPPLAVYLAQSYQEEAVPYSTIQAAIDNGPLSDEGDFHLDTSSSSKVGRSGSIITSLTSSDGTAPTTYTVSSSGGSNISSFGRDRRRGRRRMTWRASPYTRTKFNGLNSAGQPQEDLPFFCTFCPRAFKTKYEWIRHEDSVHALRTTYICCDTKHTPLQSCPFCGLVNPDEFHLATHKYQQCRNKPESQRTFYRRDHFVQHLHHVHFANVKHPSARVGCQARLMASEGHNFGCKDLAIKWRRFGAPMKADDPMLHCGFCGKRCRNWSERCDHVAEHLISRELDRSAWWPERLENHLENHCHPLAVGPFRCRYCQKVFANRSAMDKHTHCRVWSCRFLQSFDDVAAENAGPPLCPQFPSPKANHCNLCGAGYRSFHIEHAQHYHRYRLCDQSLFTSEEEFLRHLHEFHGASQPSLLRNNSVIEQNFSRNKGTSFEGVGFDEILQGCRIDDESTPFVDPFINGAPAPSQSSEDVSASSQRPPTPPRRKAHEESTEIPPTAQRSDSASTKPIPPGPRFFRLNPLVPFLSSRIYYLRNAKPAPLFSDGRAVLEEVPKSHIASLVMSSGLLGLAGSRWPVHMKRDGDKGTVEFALEEDDE